MKTTIKFLVVGMIFMVSACQKHDSLLHENEAVIENSTPFKVSFEVESETLKAQLISENNLDPVHDHASAVFKDKIWLIGGHTNGEASNTIMNSSDGVKWNTVKTRSIFPQRRGHAVVVFQNKLWVIGGSPTDEYDLFILDIEMYDDVWSSSDGITWEEVEQAPLFSGGLNGRMNHSAVVFNGEIWVFSGVPDNYLVNNFSEVQKSADGANWEEVDTVPIPYIGLNGSRSIVFDNKLWLIGGYATNENLYIESTSDGVNWENHDTGIPKYIQHQLVTDGKQMYLLAGNYVPPPTVFSYGEPSNHIWHTSNGDKWFKAKASPNFPKRTRHSSVYYKHKFWIIGGSNNDDPMGLSDIWALIPIDPYTIDDLTFQ